MTDPRYKKLAKLLVEYSTRLEKGDRVLLDMIDVPDEFSDRADAGGAGGWRHADHRSPPHAHQPRDAARHQRAHASLVRDLELFRHEEDAGLHRHSRQRQRQRERRRAPAIGWRCIPALTRPVLNYRVNKTRWCVLRWPTPSMAQAAGMSTEAFEDLYFDVCTMDYRKMARAMVPLERRMKQRRPRSAQRPRHRPHLQHQRHRRQDVQGRPEHPRRRSLLLPGQRLRSMAASSSTRRRSTPGPSSRTSAWNSRTARS